MNTTLERRLRDMRARILIRQWEYRQRRHARGMWFRLRRVLAGASEAFVIDREDALKLLAEGHQPEAVGDQLQPPKTIVFAPAASIAAMPSARRIRVGLDAPFLDAPCVALVRFPEHLPSSGRLPGSLRGRARLADEFDAPLPPDAARSPGSE